MTDYVLSAAVRVTGLDQFNSDLAKAEQSLKNLSSGSAGVGSGVSAGIDQASNAVSGFSRLLDNAWNTAQRMVGVRIFQGVEEGLRAGVDAILGFDAAMTNSLSIQRGVTDQMRANMESVAKSVAFDKGMGLAEVAEGFYHLASAGLTAEQQLRALPVVADFARAGMMDLEKATMLAVTAQTALGLRVADPVQNMTNLVRVTDVLTEAANRSMGTIEQFAAALSQKAGAAARIAGLDLEETAAVLAAFADAGVKGAAAGTAFNIVLRDLSTKALSHAEAFKALGIAVYDSAGNFTNMATIIGQMEKAFDGLSTAQIQAELKTLGFQQRSQAFILTLLGSSESLRVYEQQFRATFGSSHEVAEKQMDALINKLGQLKAALQIGAVTGFEKLVEFVGFLGREFGPAFENVGRLLGDVGARVGPVAAAFAEIGGAVVVAGIKSIAAALEALTGFLASNSSAATTFAVALGSIAAANVVSNIAALAVSFGETLYLKILYATDAVTGFVSTLGKIRAEEGALSAIRAGFDGIGAAAGAIAVGGTLAGIVAGMVGVVSAYNDGKKAAQEFAAQVNARYDTSTLDGLKAAFQEIDTELAGLYEKIDKKRGFGGFIEGIVDVIVPFRNVKDSLIDLSGEVTEMENAWRKAKQGVADFEGGLAAVQSAFGRLDGIAGPLTGLEAALVPIVARVRDLGAVNLSNLSSELANVAKNANLDPAKLGAEGFAKALAEAWVAARNLGSSSGEVAGAFAKIRDEAASADEKVKALKQAMDSLISSGTGVWDAGTKVESSLRGLVASLKESGTSFDAITVAGEKNRDALSKAAQAVADYGNAVATQTGSTEKGLAAMEAYKESLLKVLTSAGLAADKAKALVDQMGLIPREVASTLNLKIPDDQGISGVLQALKELDGKKVAAELNVTASGVADARSQVDALAAPRNQLTTAQLNANGVPETIGSWSEPRNQLTTAQLNANGVPEAIGSWTGPKNQLTTAQLNANGVREALDYLARNREAQILVTYIARNTPPGGESPAGSSANGGVLDFFARGGFSFPSTAENHVAQIAPAGSWRVWAEPETGGEAYIPLSASKRARSMAIWGEVGRRFGLFPQRGGLTYSNDSGGVSVKVPAGAVRVTVSAQVGADPGQVARLVQQAISPALEGFAQDLVTAVRRR